MTREAAKAKMNALLDGRTVEQLKDMFALVRNDNRPEACDVRGLIYIRLCELVGDDAADAIYDGTA